jgi:hypothetical protein
MQPHPQLTPLPAELHALIVSILNGRDIKSLRLTCRTLCDRTPLRIKRVFLSANLHNIEVFRAIADHETLRKGVTEVVWDDALLAESDERDYYDIYIEAHDDDEGCPAWFARSCEENLEQLSHRKGADVDHLPQHVERAKQIKAQLPLDVSYAYYQGLLMQQERVLSTQADIHALRYGITRFPALKRITITPAAHGFLYTPLYGTPMIRAFPYGFNYLIPQAWPTVQPGFSPYEAPPWDDDEAERNRWRGFRIVMRTLAEQEHRISEFVLDVKGFCTGLNCHVFDDESYEEYQHFVTLLRKPGFNRIDLALLVSRQQDQGWPSFRAGHLRRALGEVRDLQHISLYTDLGPNQEFDVTKDESNVIPLRTIFPIDRWQQLRHFGLSGFVVRQDDLISLLAAMPASLQSVELSFLFFYGDATYRSLLCDMRARLDWRDRPACKRPSVIMGTGSHISQVVGRAAWVKEEVSDFLYSDGRNPFGGEGDHRPNEIQIGFGIVRDEFDAAHKRPLLYDDGLSRLGYYPPGW